MSSSGIAFGIAVTVKAPGVVPVIATAVLSLPELRRHLLPFVAAVLAGFVIPTLPFFIVAPGSFIRDVVTTALRSIPATHRVSITMRLGDITGASDFRWRAVAIIATFVIVGIVVAAFVGVVGGRRPLEWFALAPRCLR